MLHCVATAFFESISLFDFCETAFGERLVQAIFEAYRALRVAPTNGFRVLPIKILVHQRFQGMT